MKILLKMLVPGVLLFSVLGGSAFSQTRIATVDLPKVFDKYWKTEQATAALKDRMTEMDKSRKEMIDGWKKAKEEYQKLLEDANNQAVSAEERDKRKSAAEDKLKDLKSLEDSIRQFEQQMGITLGEQKTRMRKNILEEIKLAINSKGKSGGYSLVIDLGAQTYAPDPSGAYFTPVVLYTDGQTDLTQAVISQLNAGAPVEPPRSTEKPEQPKPGKK
jgi:Skp family chaperone for outer membrane proteins